MSASFWSCDRRVLSACWLPVAPGSCSQRQEMQKLRSLVGEDDDETRKLIGRQLEVDDYRILFAADGREMLTLLAQQHPDLVVLDLYLPDLDGLEIIRQV